MKLCDTVPSSPLQSPRPVGAAVSYRWADWVLEHVDRYRGFLLLGLLGIYLLGFNAQWRIERDSALYLAIGRNLAEGDGYTFREQENSLAFPGAPLLFAATFRVFHTTSLAPALTMMFLMGWTALALTYRFFHLFAGRPTAIMITVGLGMTRLFYRYCFELLSDLPFFLGVMAFFAGYEAVFGMAQAPVSPYSTRPGSFHRRAGWYDWALLFSGLALAIAMRPAMVALLLATVLALGWRLIRGRATWFQDGLLLAVIVAAVAGFYIFIHLRRQGSVMGGDYENYLVKSLRDLGQLRVQIGENIRELFPNAAMIKALFGCKLPTLVNVIMGIVISGLAVWLFRYSVLWGLWAMLTVGMLLLFKPLDRYFLPVIPLLVFAWWRMQFWLNHRLPLHWGNLIFLFLFVGGVGTNISRIGEMVVEQRRMPFLEHYHDSRYESAKGVAKLIRTKTSPLDCVVAEPKVGRVMTFLAHRDVFESTDTVPMAPDRHLFALLGPSWEEGKEGRLRTGDPVREWLKANGMELTARVGGGIKGPHEPQPWVLYRVELKH